MRSLRLTILLSVGLALALTGCIHSSDVGRTAETKAEAKAEAAPSVGYASDEIAAAAATGAVHSSATVRDGRFGEGQVTVGEQYFSALGIPCRKVMFVGSGGGRELVACMEKKGVWATAPDIFAGPAVSVR